MPEAPVDEYGDARSREDDIGATAELRQRGEVFAESQPTAVKL